MKQRRASCACGQLVALVQGEPLRVSICHCLECQKRTGSAFGAQARFHRADVQLSGSAHEFVRTGDAGERINNRFCPQCGSTVWYTLQSQPDILAIPLGAFADPGFPPPVRSVYEHRRHAWVGLPDGLQREP